MLEFRFPMENETTGWFSSKKQSGGFRGVEGGGGVLRRAHAVVSTGYYS